MSLCSRFQMKGTSNLGPKREQHKLIDQRGPETDSLHTSSLKPEGPETRVNRPKKGERGPNQARNRKIPGRTKEDQAGQRGWFPSAALIFSHCVCHCLGHVPQLRLAQPLSEVRAVPLGGQKMRGQREINN